jgi:type IV pilus assembly protein PilE
VLAGPNARPAFEAQALFDTGDKLIMKLKQSAPRVSRHSGFTLIEVMIVVVIVAILTMIAYPSFMQSVRKSKRTDAHTALTRASNNLERFFGTNNSYTTDAGQLGLMSEGGTAYSDNGHYVMTITGGASGIGSSYVINAEAKVGDMQADDDGCTTLTLDSLGRRTPDPVDSRCW